jgi:tRNA 2-(methylsulfanyl)-N6-isopentenyladenosine37 hydroxylase
MFQLQTRTPPEWLEIVFGDFDAFLVDHTLCERKASAMGMSLVAKYPDRPLILEPLIAFAREELEHFHIMFKVLAERGLSLPADTKDAYVNGLHKAMVGDPEAIFLDRLIVSGVVEARGCERLQMVTDALPADDPLKQTYLDLTRAEARHHALFFRLAARYFSAERIKERARVLFAAEAELIAKLPLRPAVH